MHTTTATARTTDRTAPRHPAADSTMTWTLLRRSMYGTLAVGAGLGLATLPVGRADAAANTNAV